MAEVIVDDHRLMKKYALQEMITPIFSIVALSSLLFLLVSISWAVILQLPLFSHQGLKGLDNVLHVVVAIFIICLSTILIMFEALDAICVTVVMSWIRGATDIRWTSRINSDSIVNYESSTLVDYLHLLRRAPQNIEMHT
ncbi:putative transmembrane protein [Toxoplasma gondii TgCatPRC2]|uniref:Transmembrane protein n=11 Tax=Toxoplasma gondii TaxID=5811 RepID=S7VXZ3_TOXGG|nr:hypothetical protein TGGT1_209583 [Toxoplasma gondii GT1]KAF4645884.1 hypothetical protein TGRH88_021600 [Toxoplasma gondii]KFG29226.1 putative transmembrane protein [Toxoplasma gondii p89]KFG49740.1 putative transmembrane protein [Toxoplasma gondii FOU]KFG60496.1 putative transmembrane protein [Toxoplasma gondii RUB]KFH15448.1 putative transmembrane protein [Toxoplasma gondii MAS]KYF41249.1 hypothetical protein TGARI_209583 [Toxoplasma gondii ARI]KYK68610.1 putative transmembrane protein